MQTYYEKVLNGMRTPILLVAIAIVALLSASGVAMGVTSTDGRNEGHAVKGAASDGLTTRAASPTSTASQTVTINLPTTGITGSQRFERSVRFSSPVKSATVVLNGFKFNYLTSDHHTDVVEADVDLVRISADTVFIAADTTYQDKDTFNPYNGYVTATVIANVQ